MATLIALFDACVLYPAPIRDLLMHLALTGLFRARWTNQIHAEWMENVLAARKDLKREQLERTRNLMNRAVLDCLVEGYEELIDTVTLPDPDDRHVLAAAIHGGAGVIVTFNLKHFPAKFLQVHGIEAQHPDEFIGQLFQLNSEAVFGAVRRQRLSLKNPPKLPSEFLSIPALQQLPATLDRLRKEIDQI